jgi:hypothetical protein
MSPLRSHPLSAASAPTIALMCPSSGSCRCGGSPLPPASIPYLIYMASSPVQTLAGWRQRRTSPDPECLLLTSPTSYAARMRSGRCSSRCAAAATIRPTWGWCSSPRALFPAADRNPRWRHHWPPEPCAPVRLSLTELLLSAPASTTSMSSNRSRRPPTCCRQGIGLEERRRDWERRGGAGIGRRELLFHSP